MAAKLYLITRADLPPGQQAVQAAHALQEYNVRFPDQAKHWHSKSNTLVLLAVEDEPGLIDLAGQLSNLRVAVFREPDRGDELTALAVGHEGKNALKGLRLALA